MNITLLVHDELFTYNMLKKKVLSSVKERTLLCLRFDSFPTDHDIELSFLRYFNISETFDEFINSICIDPINYLKNVKDSALYHLMIGVFRERLRLNYAESPQIAKLFERHPSLFSENHKRYEDCIAFGSTYTAKSVTFPELLVEACGDPCKSVSEARFDKIPKPGEVLRYLHIRSLNPDPNNSLQIKSEYRMLIHAGSTSGDIGDIIFCRSISKEAASFLPITSNIKDFCIYEPDLNNSAHLLILRNLPQKIDWSLKFERHGFGTQFSSTIQDFFAEKFRVNCSNVSALPIPQDFIKYYLDEYLATFANQVDFDYWCSDEGQGKLLSAGF